MKFDLIAPFALRHHGLISRDQARSLGVPTSTWYSMCRRGLVEEIARGVARLPGSPDTPEQQILAAVWSVGDATLASHLSSAHVWVPEPTPPSMIDVIVPRGMRHRKLEGVRVHRPRDLVDLNPSVRSMIPTTNPLRTLVDVGAVDPDAVRGVFERMIVARLVTVRAVEAVLHRHERTGRRGVPELRAVLESWTMTEAPDSTLEEVMNALVLRFGLPPVVFHPVLCGHEVDFLVVDSPVVIECDGWATHGLDRETFEHDRERDAELTAAGYVVVRLTWRKIRWRPEQAARQLRAVIARVAPALLL